MTREQMVNFDIDLKHWAHRQIRNRRRARTLKRLNAVLVPISCLVSTWIAWEGWRAFR